MTSEHEFQLAVACLNVLPATIISIWALRNQLGQTRAKLWVRPSPVMMDTITGQEILTDDFAGVVVVNLSTFPLRICSVGYRVRGKYFAFGKPLDKDLSPLEWPAEIAPRGRKAFYLDRGTFEGIRLIKAISLELKERYVWEAGVAYALTESGQKFESRKMSRKSKMQIRSFAPELGRSGQESSN